MSGENRVRRGFDRLAPFYDGLARLVFGSRLRRSRTALMATLPVCERVLIAGEGTGEFLLALLEAGRAERVVVVDISTEMLQRAKVRIETCLPGALGRVEFRLGDLGGGDGGEFGLGSGLETGEVFDLVCTNYFLDLFEGAKLQGVMRRLGDCLRTGGLWYFTDFSLSYSQGGRRVLFGVLVRALYCFFRLFCGIGAGGLGDFVFGFRGLGFRLLRGRVLLGGVVFAGIYEKG